MYREYNKQEFLDLVIMALNLGDRGGIWLLVGYNEIAKTFTPSDLRYVEEALLVGEQRNPELYGASLSSNVYVKRWGAGVFINKLPFSYIKEPGTIMGGRTAYKYHYRDLTFPHWLEQDNTGTLRGWRLVNHFGRQNLPKLKRESVNYAIITKPENVSFYRLQHPTSRVYTYSEFYHFKVFPFDNNKIS